MFLSKFYNVYQIFANSELSQNWKIIGKIAHTTSCRLGILKRVKFCSVGNFLKKKPIFFETSGHLTYYIFTTFYINFFLAFCLKVYVFNIYTRSILSYVDIKYVGSLFFILDMFHIKLLVIIWKSITSCSYTKLALMSINCKF